VSSSDATAEVIARLGPKRLAEAIMSPLALLVAGAVGGVAIAAAGPVGLFAGVAAWAVVASRKLRPQQVLRGQVAPSTIDPFAISDPWRRSVIAAQQSQLRFQRAVQSTAKGPLRDRLRDVQGRIDQAVQESWTIAVKGDQLDDAIRDLDVRSKNAEYQAAEQTVRSNRDPSRVASLEARRDSLRSQLESASRLVELSQRTEDRLVKLNAQLDELVARGIELSVSSATGDDVGDLGAGVDAVVNEMEALQRAMEETSAISRTGRADAPSMESTHQQGTTA
jgi:hypothetical protein